MGTAPIWKGKAHTNPLYVILEKAKKRNEKSENGMIADILKLMRCPTCHTDLDLTGNAHEDSSFHILKGIVTCHNRHSWPIEEGVLVFSRDDAPSDPWSRSFKDYEKFVANKRHALSYFQSDALPIIDTISPNSHGPYLDMCTGDGTLLLTLLDKIDPDIPIVSVDMSLHAQKYNQRYFAETQGNRPVCFISSDASKLPFKDSVIPCIVSFGIGNMLGKLADGIRGARRVLQDEGVFIFNHMYVGEDSNGWRILQEILKKQGVENCGYLGLEKAFHALMKDINFSTYKVDVIEEKIGEAERDIESGPIFPYPNELQRKLLVRAWK